MHFLLGGSVGDCTDADDAKDGKVKNTDANSAVDAIVHQRQQQPASLAGRQGDVQPKWADADAQCTLKAGRLVNMA